ncbi:hypothetical protein HAX54_018057 [Datura stramonium]|uniref:Uncharacterized protein n=1 Tax=Datura stramonium TaxID=4076 RepID=A0ABS8S0Y7_DATST|nr:hypothetical protein [Datura stramonium]
MTPVYVVAQQPFTTPIPTMPHSEVDPYEEMEREAGPKVDENMEREIRNLKEAFKSIQVHKGYAGLEYEDLCVHPDIELPAGYKNGFEPGRGLRVNLNGIMESIQLPGQKYTFGLGYEPTPEEVSLASLKKM